MNLIYKTTNGGQSWVQQVSNSQSHYLNSIFFINADTGYIAGGFMFSEIQKTTDGGNNWFLQNTPGRFLSSINFINVNTGYAVGNGGTILKTNDGQNWSLQYSYLYNEEGLGDIIALNPDTVYIVGGLGQIATTTNGGNNWSSQFSGSVYNLNSICFANLNTGYAIGDGEGIGRSLIKTTNGGINWVYQTLPFEGILQKQRNKETLGATQKVYFLDSNLGFVLDGGTISKTIDGGNNWLNYTFQDSVSFCDISFIDNLTGYITGENTYKTTNGGINWFILNDTTDYINRYSIKFFNDIGYIAGENGLILKSTNGGINWISQNSGTNEDLYSIYFNNSNTGYVCGVNDILKTTNGGNNWLRLYIGEGNLFSSIYFVNMNTGYCVGNYFNGILKTTNSGNNWFSTASNYGGLSSIFFINDSIGYSCGPSGIIIKTTNGGNPIGIKEISNVILKNYILYQNYPNPFNPTTKIKFEIRPPLTPLLTKEGTGLPAEASAQAGVVLKIYDILGREVATLVNEQLKSGTYEIEWNGSKFASGVYFYQLRTKEFTQTKKLVLVK